MLWVTAILECDCAKIETLGLTVGGETHMYGERKEWNLRKSQTKFWAVN